MAVWTYGLETWMDIRTRQGYRITAFSIGKTLRYQIGCLNDGWINDEYYTSMTKHDIRIKSTKITLQLLSFDLLVYRLLKKNTDVELVFTLCITI